MLSNLLNKLKVKIQDLYEALSEYIKLRQKRFIALSIIFGLCLIGYVAFYFITKKSDEEIAKDILSRRGYTKTIYQIFKPEEPKKLIIKFQNKTVYVSKKQYNTIMKKLHRKRIKPRIIKFKKVFTNLLESKWQSTFLTMNKEGDFAKLSICKDGKLTQNPIKKGFPGVRGSNIFADKNNEVFWTIKKNNIYAYDSKLGRTATFSVKLHPGDKIVNTLFVERIDRFLLIEVKVKPRVITKKSKGTLKYSVKNKKQEQLKEDSTKLQENLTKKAGTALKFGNKVHKKTDLGSYVMLYDLFKNKIHYKSRYYQGKIVLYRPKKLLVCKTIERQGQPPLNRWFMSDIYLKRKWSNALTSALTKKNIFIKHAVKPYAITHNRLFGAYKTFNKMAMAYDINPVIIQWNNSFSLVKMSYLKKHLPEKREIGADIYNNRDGNYIKSFEIKHFIGHIIKFPPELIIYNIKTKNPHKISKPIFGGYTNKYIKGYYLNHKTWGHCYMEIDPVYNDRFVVYILK